MEIKLCTNPDCFKDGRHSHLSGEYTGHQRYLKVQPPVCDWQTCNVLTDYEIVKCTYPATHKVNDADGPGITYLCLPHADLYRVLMKKVPEKIND